MKDIRQLLNQLAEQETELQNTQFLAPCTRDGKVRTRVAGMIYTFTPKPRNFEGWGIFQPLDQKTAEVVDEPSLPQLEEYLKLLQPLRLRLAYPLKGQTWLAYPVNESDAKQRFGVAKPVALHLVSEGGQFETIIARGEGRGWWFAEIDRRAEPQLTEELRKHLKQLTVPQELKFSGLTPEMRTVYELVAARMKGFEKLSDEKRLEKALKQGGGDLKEFEDKGDFWRVDWTTVDGVRHTSAIAKQDLTVVSSGICLSGRDRDFDLQSLVGVIEAREREDWDD